MEFVPVPHKHASFLEAPPSSTYGVDQVVLIFYLSRED